MAYRLGQMLQMQACATCQACAQACPAVAGSLDGRLSAVYRLATLNKLLRKKTSFWRKLFRARPPSADELRAFSETVFRCTLCGNCRQVCPVGIDLTHLWHSLRRDLVEWGAYPQKIDMIRDNLDESRNVFGEDNEERADWVEDLPDAPDHGYVKDRAEVVYFTGCVASFFPMAQQIPMSMVHILDAAGVEFTLLGEDEWCCGFPLLGAGLSDKLDEVIGHNVEAVKAKGADRVLFACPSCHRMWEEHYPGDVKIAHETQFLLELIRSGRLSFQEMDLTVTYHDPCDLGRGSGVYDAPREIIQSIPGVRLVEMTHNRENCACCGGGGNLEMIDAGLSSAIAENKIKEAVATGAQVVVTSCQQCVRTMTTYAKRNKISMEILDIAQLVYRSISKT